MASGFSFGSVNTRDSSKVMIVNELNSKETIINVPEAVYHPLETNSFVSTVPQQKVSRYVDRPELHARLVSQLHDKLDVPTNSSIVTVVYGLSGAGKTQLVLDYIQRYSADYHSVYWIDVSSRSSMEQGVQVTTRMLYGNLPNLNTEKEQTNQTLMRMRAWFSGRSDKTLLVLDSADNVENSNDAEYVNIVSLTPPFQSAHVIITTCSRKLAEMTKNEGVEVGALGTDSALSLFWSASGLDETQMTPKDKAVANKLVQEVECLALAVELAGAAISEVDELDLESYLAELVSNRGVILRQMPEVATQYSRSILSAWETTFTHVQHRSKLAAKLLGLLSLLDSKTISLQLFKAVLQTRQSSEQNKALLAHRRWEDFMSTTGLLNLREVEKAFGALKIFGLLKYDRESKTYSMHKLVHEWGFERLHYSSERQEICEATADFLSILTETVQDSVQRQIQLAQHIMRFFETGAQCLLTVSGVELKWLVNCFREYGSVVDGAAQWSASEKIWRSTTELVEKLETKDHEVMFEAAYQLTVALDMQAKFDKAEPIARKWAERSTHLLAEHRYLTARALLALANLLLRRGNYDEALTLSLEAYEESQRVCGSQHTLTLGIQSRRAFILLSTGKLDEALPLLETLLYERRRMFGEAHEATWTEMNNLAIVLKDLGRLDEAISMQRDLVQKVSQQLGEDDAFTIKALHNLACMLMLQCKFDEAMPIETQIFTKSKDRFGDKHPLTLSFLQGLARILTGQGRYEAAAKIREELVEKVEAAFGSDNPVTIDCKQSLASTYIRIGNWSGAKALYVENFIRLSGYTERGA